MGMSCLSGGRGVVQGLAVEKGIIWSCSAWMIRVGFSKCPDLVDISKPLFLAESDGGDIDAQQPEKRGGPGKAALDDESVDICFVRPCELEGRGAAQGTAHDDQGALVAVLLQPLTNKAENDVAVLHHAGNGGRAVGAAVPR